MDMTRLIVWKAEATGVNHKSFKSYNYRVELVPIKTIYICPSGDMGVNYYFILKKSKKWYSIRT